MFVFLAGPTGARLVTTDLAAFAHHRLGRRVGIVLCRCFRFQWRLLQDRKSTRLNSSHVKISYAVFCLKTEQMPECREVGAGIEADSRALSAGRVGVCWDVA